MKAPDEYTIQVESNRGNKEFQFDHIFLAGSTQEEIFEDTNVSNVVQFIQSKVSLGKGQGFWQPFIFYLDLDQTMAPTPERPDQSNL